MKTRYSTGKIMHILSLTAMMLIMACVMTGCKENEKEEPEGDPALSVSPAELQFLNVGGEQTITIASNVAWSIRDLPDWCKVSENLNTGDAVVTVTVPSYTSDQPREGNFVVRSLAGVKTVTVQQGAIPLVTTLPAVNAMESSADLNGGWIYSGAVTITEAGFYVKAANDADSLNFKVSAPSSAQNSFTVTASGLEAATSYTYRAYVKTGEGGYSFGKAERFTTLETLAEVSIEKFLNDNGVSGIANGSQKTVTMNTSISGTVMTDRAAANYEATRLVIADVSGVLILAFAGASLNTYSAGDQLTVKMYDGKLYRNSTGVLMDSVKVANISKTGAGTVVAKTIEDIDLSKYESQYVQIDNTQLLERSLNKYPKWNDGTNPAFAAEVNGNNQSYHVQVMAGASFADATPPSGSGTLKGIVTRVSATEYALLPRNTGDMSLTGTRFASEFSMKFTEATVNGMIKKDEAITSAANITLAYVNGDESTVTVTGSVSGDGAAGISVTTFTGATLDGNGALTIGLAGTPTSGGTVTFTLHISNSITAFPDVVCETEVSAAGFKVNDVNFSGALKTGVASAGQLQFGYENAGAAQTVTFSVALSGVGADGLTTPVVVTDMPVTSGNGTFTVNVTGTPTTEGEVIFTVTGLADYGLDDGTACTAIVTTPAEPVLLAEWAYGSAPASTPVDATTTHKTGGTATITVNSIGAITIAGGANPYINAKNLGTGNYFEITVPVSSLVAGDVVTVSTTLQGGTSSANDWQFQYKNASGNFIDFGNPVSVTLGTSATNPVSISLTMPFAVTDDNLVIRMTPKTAAASGAQDMSRVYIGAASPTRVILEN